MHALIVALAGTGLALVMLVLGLQVLLAAAMLAAMFTFIGAGAAVLAYMVGLPAAEPMLGA